MSVTEMDVAYWKAKADKYRWISVKDEMPKPYVDVLVYGTTYTYGRERTFMRGSYYCGDDDGYFFCEDTDTHVTHWMPFPEPPKE